MNGYKWITSTSHERYALIIAFLLRPCQIWPDRFGSSGGIQQSEVTMGMSPVPELLLFGGLIIFVWWLWREESRQWPGQEAERVGSEPSRAGQERILFVCTHNSARSQMAEALLRRAAPGRFFVASAGTSPTQVHPLTDRVMGEIGINLRSHRAKGLPEVGTEWDYVITVCDAAFEECPEFPAKTSCLHWSIEDPSKVTGTSIERIEAFQRARDNLKARIERWLADRPERSRAK
jgi:arsenate reductase